MYKITIDKFKARLSAKVTVGHGSVFKFNVQIVHGEDLCQGFDAHTLAAQRRAAALEDAKKTEALEKSKPEEPAPGDKQEP